MTLPEWTATMIGALTEAGFVAEVYEGFPLVREPLTLPQRKALLDWRGPLASERRIYDDGMLFVPAGAHG